MQPVTDILKRNIDTREICFVFPSEVAAGFWIRYALSLTGRKAIRSDRFISWDTYKEASLSVNRNAVPANNVIRICFASDLLKRNAEDNRFIKALLLPDYANSWRPFIQVLARVLPTLGRLLTDERVALKKPLRDDLELIFKKYSDFLDSHRLFEPLYEPAGAVFGGNTVVFFPDVILDFSEYQHLLDRKAITLVDGLEPMNASVITYPNAKVEVRQTCLACRRLLDAGTPPSAIAITLVSLKGYWEELRDTGCSYDIPFVPRAGKPLADYVSVQLYRLLSECVNLRFSVGVLKELFLHTAYPWENREIGRKLVRFGLDNYGIQNRDGSGSQIDEWRERLQLAGNGELLGFYVRFKRSVTNIVNAATFLDLRASVMAFNAEFLDTLEFSESLSRPFSAALDMLSRIEDTAAQIEDLQLDSPFSLWMLCLKERPYVPQTKGDGIPVYEYRVAAGIYPDHHFILGLSQEASSVQKRPYRFLPPTMLPEEVEEGEDFTRQFYRLYEHSGRVVTMSTAVEGFEGAATPVREFAQAKPDESAKDAYRWEKEYWSGHFSPPQYIHRRQRSGFNHFAGTGFIEKQADYTSDPITTPKPAREVSNRLQDSNGMVRISPTGLDTWKHCKFRFLLSRALGLEEEALDTVFTDPRELGILYHRLFAEAMRLAEGATITNTKEVRSQTVYTVMQSVFNRWLGPRFLSPVRNDILRRAEQKLTSFLESDALKFEGSKLYSLEDTLERGFEQSGLVLYGRIDRISQQGEGFAVVDYKSRLWKKRAGMVTPQDELYSFQIPVYVLLVEGSYGPVSEALYYDIDSGTYYSVFGGDKPWFDDGEREELLRQTKNEIELMHRSISNAEYQTPAPKGGCEPCEFRPVCREKYRVR